MQEMALAETLKLLFNMTHFLNDRSSAFSTCALEPCLPSNVLTLFQVNTTSLQNSPATVVSNASIAASYIAYYQCSSEP